MPDIKIKPKENIKTLEKDKTGTLKLKCNLIDIKETLNEFNIEYNSGEDYAGRRIQNKISNGIIKGIEKLDKIGKKSIFRTKNNLIKIKNKDVISKTENKDNIKLIKKKIKITKHIFKNNKIVKKENLNNFQRMSRLSVKLMNQTLRGTKIVVKSTIKITKSIVETTKAIFSLIVAGGWIAIAIILIISLIAGFTSIMFNSNGDIDSSNIPNNEIILVAKAQLGNIGGDKFWRWYEFDTRVEWCAIFVSWCANKCGYIDKGIIPKFSVCSDGINWFKDKKQWQDRSENYYPIIGDIIFFDWIDEKGNTDGVSDHVGIITRVDITNKTIYTIEGNADDECVEKIYSFDDVEVMGYGTPKYE